MMVPSSVNDYLRLQREHRRQRLVSVHRRFTSDSDCVQSQIAASLHNTAFTRRRALLSAFEHFISKSTAPYQAALAVPSMTYINPTSPMRSPARARDLVDATCWSSLDSTLYQRYGGAVVGGVKHNGASADAMSVSERRRRLGLTHYVAE